MTELEKALRAIADELDRRSIDWALVGALAVGSRAEPRTTRDVDVVVAVDDDAAAESLTNDLRAAGFTVGTLLEHDVLERLATVRTYAPGPGVPVTVDLMFASSGIEADICRAAERIEVVPGLVAPVASIGDLIALKLLARDDRKRPQDYDDLRALLRYAHEPDLERARAAVKAIVAAGASRGRDLERALDDLLAAD
jgi:predicted nucleotidyltransferase